MPGERRRRRRTRPGARRRTRARRRSATPTPARRTAQRRRASSGSTISAQRPATANQPSSGASGSSRSATSSAPRSPRCTISSVEPVARRSGGEAAHEPNRTPACAPPRLLPQVGAGLVAGDECGSRPAARRIAGAAPIVGSHDAIDPPTLTPARIVALVLIAVAVAGLAVRAASGVRRRRSPCRPARTPGSSTCSRAPTAPSTATLPADCGTLVVPENRHDPSSRLIALPVTRIKARAGQPGRADLPPRGRARA